MDKILQSMSGRGDIQVTNDGATILKSIHLDNAAAKVLVSKRDSKLLNRHFQGSR
jgi:T-complex protein 1 subunit beta